MKMEPIVSSETSAIRTQTPGNYPKRNKLHLEHGESLKTRTYDVYTAIQADRCGSQLPLLLAAITTPQYQPPPPSIQRHPMDNSSNNGELYAIIDVT